ncbi:ABC protein [Mycena sanguinolenta]|uniref:ABC protein n=1 Tax=Mycena sanguinolenta TaxID=230812 RepID=A0A8H6XNY1_9AGAR|nr:ABC protein [Mycena sanguinolenta]
MEVTEEKALYTSLNLPRFFLDCLCIAPSVALSGHLPSYLAGAASPMYVRIRRRHRTNTWILARCIKVEVSAQEACPRDVCVGDEERSDGIGDPEIAQLKDQLSQLEEERAALEKHHVQHSTILSSMRRVPAEILGEIFFWSCSLYSELDMKDSPWVLTHVSRRWRAVAIAKSWLWSRIHLDFFFAKKIFVGYGVRRPNSRPQVNMLQLLLQHSSIWEDFYIRLTADLVTPMAACRGRLPLLQRVSLQGDGQEDQMGIESLDFFTSAPSLTDITVRWEHRFLPILLPAHRQLTRYDVTAPWTIHYELLKSLPNLHEVCIFRRFDHSVPWPAAREPIHLGHLRSMYLTDIQCLDYLRAPVLQNIAFAIPESIDARRFLEPFITRSSCVLRRLCIVGLPDTQCAEEVLKQYPSITQFALWIVDRKHDIKTERDLLTAFLTRLTVSTSTRILPHISKLGFACQHANTIPYPLYVNMLDSRWSAPDCALKAAEILITTADADPESDPESLAKMETLRQVGMQVSFLLGNIARVRADEWVLRESNWKWTV